jgi:hypothetical protein
MIVMDSISGVVTIIGVMMLAIGFGFLTAELAEFLVQKLKNAKIARYADRMRKSAEEEVVRMKQQALTSHTSQLYLRNKQGKLFKVNIIIDPDLEGKPVPSPDRLKELADRGEAGTLSDLISGKTVASEELYEVSDFVFSPAMVRQLSEAGLEPDDVVIRMLRATGRID